MKLTHDEWKTAQHIWENDTRPGFQWLKLELKLDCTISAIKQQARKKGWQKKVTPREIKDRVFLEADKQIKMLSKLPLEKQHKDAQVAVERAIILRTDIIVKHRNEWQDFDKQFQPVLKNVENYKIEDDYFRKSSYNLKTLAETIRIKQDGERKAWGLDTATDDDNTTPQQTLEQLNAIYEMAMQKANDDKQKMLERFNSVS